MNLNRIAIILLIIFGFYWLDHLNIKNWGFDDSYFGYTYAQNLTEGNGFTFNHTKIIGTSAPLPVLFYSTIKIISKIFISYLSIETIGKYTSIISIIVSGLLLFQITKHYTQSLLISLASGGLLYSNLPYLMLFGHESIIAILLVLISILLIIKKRYSLSSIIIGLAFLCRAESLALLPFLVYHAHQSNKNIPQLIKYLFLASLPIILWGIFSVYYFGQLTSNSFSFKIYQSKLTNAQFFPDLLSWINQVITPKYFNWFILSISLLGIIQSTGSVLILSLCLLIIPIIFYSLINIAYYHWFLYLGSVAVLIGISQFLKTYRSRPVVFYSLLVIVLYSSLMTTENYAKNLPNPRFFMYQNIGKYLNQNSHRSDEVAFVEIGQIAYFSQNRIVDVTGITSPNILKELKKGNHCYPYEFYRPKYIIYDPPFSWLTNPLECDYVAKNYTLVHQFDSPNYRSLYLYADTNLPH